MRSGKRNPLWHLFRLELRLRGRWSYVSDAIGPWPVWWTPYDPLQARALHIERRECGDGKGEDVDCTHAHFSAAMEAIQCPP